MARPGGGQRPHVAPPDPQPGLEKDLPRLDLLRLIAILRRRFPVLLLGAVLGALLGYTVSLMLPRTYTATATLLVFQTSSVGNVQLGDLMASERLARTYADLLTRHPVLSQTIADLHL